MVLSRIQFTQLESSPYIYALNFDVPFVVPRPSFHK